MTFTIHAAAPFDLYANILVPDVPGVTTTLSALVSQDGKDIVTLEAPRMLWQTFYEEFAKPWDQTRLPMRFQPQSAAVDVYRLWRDRNGGQRKSTVLPPG